jgi:hypothetical protein
MNVVLPAAIICIKTEKILKIEPHKKAKGYIFERSKEQLSVCDSSTTTCKQISEDANHYDSDPILFALRSLMGRVVYVWLPSKLSESVEHIMHVSRGGDGWKG